jgi:(p)ppGpp synthase/HD superfamily hydrolase
MNTKLKAYYFAEKKHKGQLDDNGKDYFAEHCHKVARAVGILTDDEDIISAAWLHDTIEDTETTYEELVKEFNKRVADLVMEVTHEGCKDNYGYYFPRLKTKEGILIKLCDRASNISRMDTWDDKRQSQYCKRTKFGKTEVTEIISDMIKILAVIAVIIYLFINNKDVINERFVK